MSKARQSRRKQMREGTYIDKDLQNKGGFYRGMPGATIENFEGMDYRKMITFVVSEDGHATSLLYAHPQQVTIAMAEAGMNKDVGAMVVSSASKIVRGNKWKWFGAFYFFKSIRQQREMKKMSKAIDKITAQIEALTKTATEQN